MLEFSHQEFTFQWKQMKKSLMLTNNSDSCIIYKVKTNLLNLIIATPSKGYIQPKKTVKIQIKCEKLEAFQAKLQVIYNVFLQMKGSIDQTFKSLNQSQLKTNMVYLRKEQESNRSQEQSVKINKEEKQNQKSMSMHSSMSQSLIQSQNNSRIDQSNIYESKKQTLKMIKSITTPISQKSEKESSKKFIKKNNTMEQEARIFEQQVLEEELKRSKNTVISQNQNNFNYQNMSKNTRTINSLNTNHQNGRISSYNYMNHSHLVKLATIQQQLLKQKQINQKLSQRLVKTNQLNRDRYQYQMQSRINNSMQACPQDHFSLWTILVVCLIFFMIGFLIAKF